MPDIFIGGCNIKEILGLDLWKGMVGWIEE